MLTRIKAQLASWHPEFLNGDPLLTVTTAEGAGGGAGAGGATGVPDEGAEAGPAPWAFNARRAIE